MQQVCLQFSAVRGIRFFCVPVSVLGPDRVETQEVEISGGSCRFWPHRSAMGALRQTPIFTLEGVFPQEEYTVKGGMVR